MKVFPKLGIHPIIIPTKIFESKHGISKNFTEMNPSVFIDHNDNVTILVRCVNYSKYPDNNFILHEGKSNSIYFKLYGKIQNNFSVDNLECEEIVSKYNLEKHWSHWRGLEDIRFLNANDILVTVPELNLSGAPCIFKARLEDNVISSFYVCNPNIEEKNWMPYKYNYETKVIYNVSPFQIKSIEEDDKITIEVSDDIKEKLEGYHGSSNGVEFMDSILFLIHKNEEVVKHRWLLFNPSTNMIRISEPFVFFKHSYIEFTCSMVRHLGKLFVSLGVNDDKAFILELSLSEIEKSIYYK
jgi:predicted GH43/DUF377 family glycosyl hydrolase